MTKWAGSVSAKTSTVALALLLACGSASSIAQQQPPHVTSPEEAFGFKLGTDRKLADWVQLTAFYRKLAAESPRVRYEELGKTTEGRPFVSVTISSAENIAHLDEYKGIQARLADPRLTTPEQARELETRGKTVLVVTCNIHSIEIASSQSCAGFAYMLATGTSPNGQQDAHAILANTIVVLIPSLNPDGQQLVVDWYKKYLGTPYEGASPVVLWHHYTGHDDNRDWYAFTQVETQLTVNKVLNVWHPQILYDLHQMGSGGPRIWLPPWVDPIDPNVDPLLVMSMNAAGTQAAYEIMETGKSGVLIDGVYDMWSPARAYVAYHAGPAAAVGVSQRQHRLAQGNPLQQARQGASATTPKSLSGTFPTHGRAEPGGSAISSPTRPTRSSPSHATPPTTARAFSPRLLPLRPERRGAEVWRPVCLRDPRRPDRSPAPPPAW